MANYCSRCGKSLDIGDSYCSKCGKLLSSFAISNEKSKKKEKRKKCSHCDGSGRVSPIHSDLPPAWLLSIFTLGIADVVGEKLMECPECNGTGYVNK